MTSEPLGSLVARLRGLDRRLTAALVAVALVRPLFSVAGWSEALGKPLTPLLLTFGISAVWILAVGLSRGPEPFLTPVAAGVGYAVAALILSGALSPFVAGELRGPLAQPLAVVPLFVVNAAWGAVCGVCATGVRRLRSV
ncbi:hypothetical protein DSC45_13630 [Streptomyces sp. YIM 130001]|uniref:hypothetical protein n=1 Tax=Streptomyces sp. YIM 130001 TaxID=2259644 RepID=UPI000E64D022|nr:hypothetical protein [Streptomyces sp. YIM 130001]RII17199.1 hypothetical protein DSC45_13630 [Streptomyces sp. YIM 130001]